MFMLHLEICSRIYILIFSINLNQDLQDFSLKFDILDVDLMINSPPVRFNIEIV